MNESSLIALIGEGESEKTDYKITLDLDSARAKAEFVKDVISIANSATGVGYLFIGVQDDKSIVGAANLEEERIQQIAQTYIQPIVIIHCEMLPIASLGFLQIGIIEVRATSRPHKVARAIESLNQNDVFVRHGSVVSKASPEEIIQMHDEDNELSRASRQYIKSAQIHLRLKNYDSAITAYSRALELTPSAQLFIARAEARIQSNRIPKGYWKNDEEHIAFTKDLTDAIELATSAKNVDLIKAARTLRYKYGYYSATENDSDFEWLKLSFEGIERAKFIFEALIADDFVYSSPEKAIPMLKEVLELGYEEPEVFLELAVAHHNSFNYGLALDTINGVLSTLNIVHKEYAKLLAYKGGLLALMGKYQEAQNCYRQADELLAKNDGQSVTFYSPFPTTLDKERILLSAVLAHEFDKSISWLHKLCLKVYVFDLGRDLTSIELDQTGMKIAKFNIHIRELDNKYPGITKTLREILGEEDWQKVYDDIPLVIKVQFPSISDQIEALELQIARFYS